MQRGIALIALAIASSIAVAAPPARDWTLIDIGTLGGPGSYGAAVSDSGYVVGCADVAAGGSHAFIYRDGVMRDLEAGSAPAGASGCAVAVNNDGVAAGRSAGGELVVWNGPSVTRLGVEGDIGGINDAGVVVGTYRFGVSTRAFLFRRGSIVNLGTLGGSDTDPYVSSGASAINERNQVAGTSNGRAFLHDNGSMRDLGTLGGSSGSAKGINDRGEVVGMSTDSYSQPSPFIHDGRMRPLPGPSYSGAIAINNRGQVIGSGEGVYGYLIDGGKYTRLDTLPVVAAKGWRHLEPTGINDRGWIVGTASDAEGNMRAFLLVPGRPTVVSLPWPTPVNSEKASYRY